MLITSSRTVAAPPEQVFNALVDVERWPEWTASVTSVQRLEPGELAVGSTAKVKQPKLRDAVWQVTEMNDRDFSWVSRQPGVLTTGRHHVAPDGEGCKVTLQIEHTGALSGLVGALTRRLTLRYLQMEGEGLQRLCEK